MAFERIKIEVKPASIGTGIKVSLTKAKTGAAKMKFIISSVVGKTLNWQSGDKLEVLIGTGSDHGLLRFRKNNSVGDAEVVSRKSAKGDWFVLSLGAQPAFIDRSESARWCQFEQIEDGYVELVLPRWAEETAPKKTVVNNISMQQVAKPMTPRPTSVTGQLMGDPPANRKQIMAKLGDAKA